MTEKQAMVDKLKTNKLPWCFLEKAEQDLLGEHPEHTMILTSNGFAPKNTANYKTFHPTNVYRLSPDFTLPPKRWFYCDQTHCLHKAENPASFESNSDWVEVPPADLECVRAQIERKDIDLSEWEYRLIKMGVEETWIQPNGQVVTATLTSGSFSNRFVRKAEAKKSGGWKEFDIDRFNGQLRLINFPDGRNQQPLSVALAHAIDRGMCPEFWFEGISGWYLIPTQRMEKDKPAKLLKMRVWEEGK